MAVWIQAQRHIPKKVKTKYPSQRECANKMIDEPEFRKFTMVHAFIVDKSGRVKANAFLMKGNRVFDGVTRKETTLKSFKRRKKIISAFKYTYKEVRANMRLFERYGRWEEL